MFAEMFFPPQAHKPASAGAAQSKNAERKQNKQLCVFPAFIQL